MPPKKPEGTGPKKTVNQSGGEAFARKKSVGEPVAATQGSAREFQSELAMDIIEQLYPLLLENCTDDEDEIDTQAVFEVLAGLMGLFTADYHQNYGQEKSMAAFQGLVELALQTYQQRVAEQADD